jgi:HlyD family secretion protein
MKMPSKSVLLVAAALVVAAIAVKLIFFRKTFRYAGTLEGTKVDIPSRLSSTIQEMLVDEGYKVQKGQLLVKLSCEDYIEAAKIATINFERNKGLHRAGTVTKEVLDQLENAKIQADIKTGWCAIDSPLDGTVLSRYHEPGEWVDPGTRLLTLANIKDIWAYIYIPQPEVAKLKPGQKLTGYLPELGDRKFEGTIVKINDEAEFTPKNVQTRAERTRLVFGVKVSFLGANDDETLKPGMTIEIELPH